MLSYGAIVYCGERLKKKGRYRAHLRPIPAPSSQPHGQNFLPKESDMKVNGLWNGVLRVISLWQRACQREDSESPLPWPPSGLVFGRGKSLGVLLSQHIGRIKASINGSMSFFGGPRSCTSPYCSDATINSLQAAHIIAILVRSISCSHDDSYKRINGC